MQRGRLLQTIVHHHGIDCASARDGGEGLHAMDGEEFAAVLLYLLMPYVSGFDVLRDMRLNRPFTLTY